MFLLTPHSKRNITKVPNDKIKNILLAVFTFSFISFKKPLQISFTLPVPAALLFYDNFYK